MISSRKRPQSSFDASSCGHRRHTLMCHMCQAPGKHKLSHQGPTTRSSSRFVLLRWVPGMLVRPDRDRIGARCSSGRRHHRQPAGARGEMPALQERQHRGIILSRVLSPTPRPEEPLAVVRWSPVGPTIRHGRCHAGGVMSCEDRASAWAGAGRSDSDPAPEMACSSHGYKPPMRPTAGHASCSGAAGVISSVCSCAWQARRARPWR